MTLIRILCIDDWTQQEVVEECNAESSKEGYRTLNYIVFCLFVCFFVLIKSKWKVIDIKNIRFNQAILSVIVNI